MTLLNLIVFPKQLNVPIAFQKILSYNSKKALLSTIKLISICNDLKKKIVLNNFSYIFIYIRIC